jgi:hypothetical protein
MADVESAELARQIDEAGHRMLGLLPSVLRRRGAAVNLRGIESVFCVSTRLRIVRILSFLS